MSETVKTTDVFEDLSETVQKSCKLFLTGFMTSHEQQAGNLGAQAGQSHVLMGQFEVRKARWNGFVFDAKIKNNLIFQLYIFKSY